MAVVATETVNLWGQKFRKVYNVDRSGKFWMKMPDCVTQKLGGKGRIYSNSMDDLKAQFNRLVKEHDQSEAITRKVIAIVVQMDMIQEKNGKVLRIVDNVVSPLGIEVFAGVFQEHSIVGGAVTRRVFEESTIPKSAYCKCSDPTRFGATIIDWTPEREERVAQFVRSIESTIEQAIVFMEEFGAMPNMTVEEIDEREEE